MRARSVACALGRDSGLALRHGARWGLGPATDRAATAEYRTEMDVLADFIEERCLRGDRFWATADELHKAYKEWAVGHGEKEKNVMTPTLFGRLLDERGFRRDRHSVGGLKPCPRTGAGPAGKWSVEKPPGDLLGPAVEGRPRKNLPRLEGFDNVHRWRDRQRHPDVREIGA